MTTVAALLWFALVNPPTQWVTNGPAYPHVDAVAASLQDAVVYAAARNDLEQSALFRSQDGGDHWTMLAQAPLFEIIETIAIDPTDTRRLLATTSLHGPSTTGIKIYRSEDAGNTWTLNGSIFSVPDSAQPVFNPVRSDVAVLAGPGGLWRSEGGAWVSVQTFPTTSRTWYTPDGVLYYVNLHCPLICYPNRSRSVIVRSKDDGDSGREIGIGPCLKFDNVIVSAADPSVFFGTGPGCETLFRSVDAGASWDRWDPSGDLRQLLSGPPTRVVRVLAADPASPDTLYALVASENGSSPVVIRSRDGGGSWESLERPGPHPVTISGGGSGTLYVGTSQGVFRFGRATRVVSRSPGP